MQESSGLSLGDHAAQEHPEAMQCGVGIMAQYLQASQSQLGAVHGHAETLSDHWQRIGAARDGKLDDVVHVKVGKGGSVRSVYESSESLSTSSCAQAESSAGDDSTRESMELAIGAAISGICQLEILQIRPDLHEGEEQAKMGGEQSCLSSSSDKVAEAQSKSVCSLDDTEDEQHMAI